MQIAPHAVSPMESESTTQRRSVNVKKVVRLISLLGTEISRQVIGRLQGGKTWPCTENLLVEGCLER